MLLPGITSTDDLPIDLENDDSSLIEKMGARLDQSLQEFFSWWGKGK